MWIGKKHLSLLIENAKLDEKLKVLGMIKLFLDAPGEGDLVVASKQTLCVLADKLREADSIELIRKWGVKV